MLNEMCRKSKEFRAWVRKEAPTSRDKPQSPGKPQRRES